MWYERRMQRPYAFKDLNAKLPEKLQISICTEVFFKLLYESDWKIRDSWLICLRQGLNTKVPSHKL